MRRSGDQGLSGPIIFLHIPKTAGSTLRQILRRQYGTRGVFEVDGYSIEQSMERFIGLRRRRRKRISVFLAQVPFGLHQMIPGPSQYITLLRHPVGRIVSHYSYVSRDPTSHLHAEVVARKLGLRDYVLGSRWASLINNGQTSHLGNDVFPQQRTATRDMLEIAKANLDNSFAVVGITEKFDESIMLLKNTFGWHAPFYTKQKVSPAIPQQELTPRVVDEILDRNQLDLELYDYALARFEETLRHQDAAFFKELKEFRDANAANNIRQA